MEKIGTSETYKSPEVSHAKNLEMPRGALVLMIGVPGSGKSTFAAANFPTESIVSTDDIRGELTNNPANWNMSEPAFSLARDLVDSRLKNGRLVVLDAMNLSPNARRGFLNLAKKYNAPVVGVHFDYPLEVLLERDKSRGNKVGEKAIKRKEQQVAELNSAYVDHLINKIFVVDKDNDQDIKVTLPENELTDLEADRDFYQVAHRAEADVFDYLAKHKEKLQNESLPRVEIDPAKPVLIEDSPAARKFLENNTIPTQVLDLAFLAKRMGVKGDDPLFIETGRKILSQRTALNLVTFILTTGETKAAALAIKNLLEAKKVTVAEIQATDKDLETGVLKIKRDELEDERLLVLGDVHGSLIALRKMHQELMDDNRANPDLPARKIVFVGDLPDRGKYSALAVIYAASLVRRGRAEWILGNHDQNMLAGLEVINQTFKKSGKDWAVWLKEDYEAKALNLLETVKSRATVKSIEELMGFIGQPGKEKPLTTEKTFELILDTLRKAPLYKQWRHLVAVHASLPKIPSPNEEIDAALAKDMTHGMKLNVGVVQEALKLRLVAAKDPDRILVGGHTHDEGVTWDHRSGTVGLDDAGPALKGLYYPEMKLTSHDEPFLVEMTSWLYGTELPTGKKLWQLVDYLQDSLMIKTNSGPKGSIYEDLTVISYHPMAELNNSWEKFPLLRNFRGLIIDQEGKIVARPFKKTHKAGIEIPLKDLEIVPEKVFEKANGSMGICYNWQGSWHFATKMSLQNEAYTKRAMGMMKKMNTAGLDPTFTYLFEIILPEDPHIVDYKGEEALVLLNAIHTKSAKSLDWEEVANTAKGLGCRTALDLTSQFEGLTIAQIYKQAQTEGQLVNLEGLMAVYRNETTGELETIKVKAVDYDNKKFVRDRLKWKKIFDALDWETLEIDGDKKETMLSYQRDNTFVRAAFEARLDWIRAEALRLVNEFMDAYADIILKAFEAHDKAKAAGADQKRAVNEAIGLAIKELPGSEEKGYKNLNNLLLGYIRSSLLGYKNNLNVYAQASIINKIEKEIERRGHAAYWLVPQ